MIPKQRQSIDWLINRETQREPIIFDLRGAKFVSALRRVSVVSFASATYRKTAPENSSKVENYGAFLGSKLSDTFYMAN